MGLLSVIAIVFIVDLIVSLLLDRVAGFREVRRLMSCSSPRPGILPQFVRGFDAHLHQE
jgi:hypothetical protein